MPSRYNTYNPDLKISQGSGAKPSGPGKSGTVNVRQSYTGMPLPGKASHAFAEAKKGCREVNGYAAYKGLSQSSTGDDYNRDKAAYQKAAARMQEYDDQENAGINVVNHARRNAKGDYSRTGTKTPYEVDPRKLGDSDTPYGALYERKYGPKKR